MKRYPGLSPFSIEQKELFYGRDDDIKELSNLIFIERKVLLYSKSGYGKTSLLNAGVIPELEKNKGFEFIKVRFRAYNKENPPPEPGISFLQEVKLHTDFKQIDNSKTIIDQYAPKHNNEYWSVFKKNQLLGNNKKTYILIFDQFEELFSYPEEQIDKFKKSFAEIIHSNKLPVFFEELEDQIFENKEKVKKEDADLLYEAINIKAVFSIRSDRMSELNYLADRITDIQKVFYELQPLKTEQARQAIVNPAEREGDFESPPFSYESKAIDKIINELTDGGEQKIETTQLQIVCQRIEENIIVKTHGRASQRENQQGLVITEKDIPDFKDIFLVFYNDSVSKVKTDEHKTVNKFIEDQLIIDGRRISLDQFVCHRYVKQETLQALVDNYFLRAERNSTEGISYELSHDTLIEPIEEVALGRREKEKDRKRRRRFMIIGSVSLGIVAVLLGLAFTFYGMYQKAEIAKNEAEKAQIEAEKQTTIANEEKRVSDSLRTETQEALDKFIQAEIDGLLLKANNYLSFGEKDLALKTLKDALKMDSTNVEVIKQLKKIKN